MDGLLFLVGLAAVVVVIALWAESEVVTSASARVVRFVRRLLAVCMWAGFAVLWFLSMLNPGFPELTIILVILGAPVLIVHYWLLRSVR
jgi:hypothetical protein